MAFSRSIIRAQVQKLCDLCEKEPVIKWICVQCNKYMCENCKNIHLKVATSFQHEIVDVRKDISDLQRQIITDNIPCGQHRKNCCLFCRTCEILVCPDCIPSLHPAHQFENLENIMSEKVENLRTSETNIQTDLSQCQTKVKEIKSIEAKCDSMFNEAVTNIKLRDKTLKDAISKYSKQLLDEIDIERKTVKKSLSDIQQKTEEAEKKLVKTRDQIQTTLATNQGKAIFDTKLEYISRVKFDPFPSNTKQFTSGEVASTSISELFGYLKTCKLPQPQIDMEIEVVKTVTTDLPYISQLVIVDEISAWISCCREDAVRKIKIEDEDIKTIQQISVKVNDMTITPNNGILLSMFNSCYIKLLTKTGEIKPFLSVPSDLQICCIHMNNDNNVLVGVEEEGAKLKTTDDSTRALYIFGTKRKLEKTYQYDKNKERLFTIPSRVTTNSVNDILVIDKTSKNTGRVVVLSKKGDLKWTYEGNSQININKPFMPRGIITTESGNVMVSDFDTHALHVLSGDGQIVSSVVMKDMGITYPISVDIDTKGQYWVGCHNKENKGAEIHIIKDLN